MPRFSAWTAPSLGETVRLVPQTTQPHPSVDAGLRATLHDVARRLRGAWRVAVVRRALLSGLAVGCLVGLAADWVGLPEWLGPAAACAAALAVGLWGFRLAPGTAAAARFLDHRLVLKEQLATALELDSGPSKQSRTALGTALEGKAAATLEAISKEWVVRPTLAGREWGAAIVLVALLAVIVISPFGGHGQGAVAILPPAGGNVAGGSAPDIPTGPANTKPFSVQVAVVSAPSAVPTSSGKIGAVVPKAHATVVNPGALGQSSNLGTGQPPAPTPVPGSSSKGSAKATPVTAPHTAPLIQGNQGFLPTSPSAKGKASGAFAEAPTKSVQSPGTLGSLAGGPASSKSTSGPSANGKGNASQGKGAGSKGAGTSSSGKQGAGSAQAGNCALTYACNKLNPKALTAPGLITGKGQFTGQGGKGGQISGHAAGAPLKPSTAKASTPPTQSKQLTINSSYGSNKTSGERAQQVQGHNGAGTSQQTTVTAGAGSGQSVDYVAPDANIHQPSEDGIVSRYFVASAAS